MKVTAKASKSKAVVIKKNGIYFRNGTYRVVDEVTVDRFGCTCVEASAVASSAYWLLSSKVVYFAEAAK